MQIFLDIKVKTRADLIVSAAIPSVEKHGQCHFHGALERVFSHFAIKFNLSPLGPALVKL